MGKKKIKQADIANCSRDVDLEKTAQYLQDPNKANDAQIQFTYGTRCMKKTGMPVTKDRIKEAEVWFAKAASQGHVLAHLSLGILYIGAYPEAHLRAVELNKEKAFKHFKYAAERGIPEAQYRLAVILEKTPGELQLAVSWLVKAAEKHKSAQGRLALMYLKGNQIIPQDKARGIEMLEIAAREGYAEALYHLGRAYEKGDGVAKDNVKSVELLAQAAKKKYKDALLHLATKYELGDGVPKDDTEAIRLLTLGANVEYPEAQLRLAIKYELGEGTAKDDNQAIRLLNQAAELGYTEAQFYLAIKYEESNGIEKDEAKALALLTKAAEKGYKEAQFYLGVKYYDGRGIEKDEVQAVDWLTRAADGKHSGAKECLRNLAEKSIFLNDIYAGTKQLIRVSHRILGEKYDIAKIFHSLLPEGIPELEEETFYYYTYKIFPSEEYLPSVKQPEIVYLYMKNDKLNYYILNASSGSLGEKVYSGTLHLHPDLNLSCLQSSLEKQLIENECIEPSYEVRLNMQKQYEEFFLYEEKFSAFLLEILRILESQEFCDCIQGNEDFNVLKDNITTTAKNLLQNQTLICRNLEREFKDSSQMIDILKESYGTTINLEDFYNMGCCMKQLDKQLEYLSTKKKTLINIIFQPLRLTAVYAASMSGENFQAIFEQYTTGRKMLFQKLATYFRKKHPTFYNLENIFILCEKITSISTMIHDSTHLMVMSNLQTQLKEENNIFKIICFEFLQPVCYLLIMDIQQTPVSVIYKSLLEKQKPILFKAMLDLQKQMSDFKRKSNSEAEIRLCPNADNIQELFNDLKVTSNLSDIIWILVKTIQIIEPFVLDLNASRNSQGSNRRSSEDSAENTQSLESLQGTFEDLLSEPVLSPKDNKGKSITIAELKKNKRKSIMTLRQLSSRMSRKNEAILEPVPENEHEYKSSALLSPDIGNGKQELISVDDMGLILSPNKSESDNMPCNLSDPIENSHNADQNLLTASISSHMRDRLYSPIGKDSVISSKVRYRDNAIDTTLSQNGSSNQQGDITLRSTNGDGERHRSSKRNRRGTYHFSDPMGLNQDLSSQSSQDSIKPKKGKSLKEKLSFFHSDNINAAEVRNNLRSSLQPI